MNSGTNFAPTRLGGVPDTFTVRCTPATFALMISPTRTTRAGFTRCPLMSTCPSRQAFAASERVLNRRTVQSHLSMRVSLLKANQRVEATNTSANRSSCAGECSLEIVNRK